MVACAGLFAGLSQIGGGTGIALGPLIALVPPNEVTSDQFGITDNVVNPTISGRGDAAAIQHAQSFAVGFRSRIIETEQGGFVLLDTAGPDQMHLGKSIAVSADGCASVWARDGFDDLGGPFTSIGITERCRGFEGEFTRVPSGYTGRERIAVSATGRFVVYPDPFDFGFFGRLLRFDIDTGQSAELLSPKGSSWRTDNGLDISADGNIVVATGDTSPQGGVTDVYVWEVDTGAVRTLGATGTTNATVSADGRFVAYDTIVQGFPIKRGVFVFDRVTGATQLVNPAAENAVMPSISGDGSQVAYAIGACSGRGCGLNRVDVAYSPVPGMTGGIQYETVSLGVSGQPILGLEPDLTGSGRYVVFTSDQGGALTGSTAIFGTQAFVRERDAGLTIAPNPLDFGTIEVNSNRSQPVTVTNTGRTSVFLDSIAVSGSSRFAPVAGGSCAQGASLPPGASCTVNVQFVAPANATTVTASLFVGETRFDPVSTSTRLIGRSSVTPPGTTTVPTTLPGATTSSSTTTTTTTTIVSGGSPTTSTTVPGKPALVADPTEIDYGPVAVGFAAPFQTITVTNIGDAAGVVLTTMEGANPDDFFVSDNQCSGAALAPGASCVITVTMVALAGGDRAASLTVSSGGSGGDISLKGQGRFVPRVVTSPAAVTVNGITTVVGLGFPVGVPVTVRVGATGLAFEATPDAAGRFQIPFPLHDRLALGNYVLQADAVATVYDAVLGQLVVVLPTFEPQGPGGPAFGNSNLVTRGG